MSRKKNSRKGSSKRRGGGWLFSSNRNRRLAAEAVGEVSPSSSSNDVVVEEEQQAGAGAGLIEEDGLLLEVEEKVEDIEEKGERVSLNKLRPRVGVRGQRVRGHNWRRDSVEFSSSMDCPIAVNLTKHLISGTEEFDVVEFSVARRRELLRLLTFNDVPSWEEVKDRARRIADLAGGTRARYAVLGGAPYLCCVLVGELEKRGITPIFSYSNREFMAVPAAAGGGEGESDGCGVVIQRCYTHLGWIVSSPCQQ